MYHFYESSKSLITEEFAQSQFLYPVNRSILNEQNPESILSIFYYLSRHTWAIHLIWIPIICKNTNEPHGQPNHIKRKVTLCGFMLNFTWTRFSRLYGSINLVMAFVIFCRLPKMKIKRHLGIIYIKESNSLLTVHSDKKLNGYSF